MWLIDTALLELRFHTTLAPQSYAILSHTWVEEEEVSFQEFRDVDTRHRKKGFKKITAACGLARLRGLKWCWVDTCCIDKSSSAELSEAINSMFRWYKESAICFAYLSDLLPDPLDGSIVNFDQDFAQCAWFRRGWTLQELIAPKTLEFFDRGWNMRGTKAALTNTLHNITGVSTRVLENSDRLRETPVGTRMSWAADRQTKRVEDIAYCLLGIFDIYMPLIYGEGKRAFSRLQQEIIKDKHDLSIFAWKAEPNGQRFRGLLARSPSEFRLCRDAQLSHHLKMTTEYSITNRGVQLYTLLGTDDDGNYVLPLGCTLKDAASHGSKKRDTSDEKDSVGVYLKKAPNYGLVRAHPDKLHTYKGWTSLMMSKHGCKKIHAPQDLTVYDCSAIDEQHHLSIRIGESNSPVEIRSTGPDDSWDANSRMFITMADQRFTGYCRLRIRPSHKSSFECILVCGLMRIPSIDKNSIRVNDDNNLYVRAWCSIFSSPSLMWTELCDLTRGKEAQDLLHLRNTVDKKVGKCDSDRCVSETTSEIVLVSVSAEKEQNHGIWSFRINISVDCIPRRPQNAEEKIYKLREHGKTTIMKRISK
ncbi:heterokaryon incompatibility protein-domain-containing protein [Xylaria digitata]|nr:heterokaryon incompatibility protein-domain-containing protein [Xylaria digitata]